MTQLSTLESSDALFSTLAQTTTITGGGGSVSLEIILTISVVAVVVLGIAWMLWGGAGAD